jgi:hypothetical protein
MPAPRRFLLSSILALTAPLALYVAVSRGSFDGWTDFLVNYGFMTAPQILVLIAALVVPLLRQRFAPIALLALTALVVLFQCIISSASGGDGPMLWVFYPPVSLVVIIAVMLSLGRLRGSNNRWRGP